MIRIPTGLLALGVASCTLVGPGHAPPQIPVPDYWNAGLRADLDTATPDIEAWWTRFDDPALTRLIRLAKSGNRTLAIAGERVTEARAREAQARGSLLPSLTAGGGTTRKRSSESVPFDPPNPATVSEAGLAAGWEVDFVGGLRRTVQAARASTEATQEIYRDTLVLLYADVARHYITYRTLQHRLALARENIAAQEQSVKLTREREEAGLAPKIDVSQAETNLATSQALVPQLQAERAAVLGRLAVLVGRYPGQVEDLLGRGTAIPTPRRSLSVGLPANLLRSRPDIRAAERTLAARTARIGVAQAELYPKFSLSGTFALRAGSRNSFTDDDSQAWSFGPSFRWRLFEGGRIRAMVREEESRARQALAEYEQTVLEAVAEVETALAAIKFEDQRRQILERSVRSSRETVGYIKDNYTNGLVDFQNVLDAERNLFDQQDRAAASRGLLAINHVTLYRALGGGTSMPEQPVLADKP